MIRNHSRFLVLSAALFMAGSTLVHAGGAAKPAADLDLVPDKAQVVLSCKVADLWSSEGAAGIRKLAKDEPGLAASIAQMEMTAGIALTDVERVIVAGWGSVNAPQLLFIVSTSKPLDQAKLRTALAPEAAEKQLQQKSYFAGKNGKAIYFVNDRTFAAGATGDIEALLIRGAGKAQRPLGDALKLANRQLVIGLQVGELAKLVADGTPPPLQAALQAETATVSAAIAKKKLTVDAQLRFGSKDAAEAGEKSVRAALAIAQQSIPAIIQQVSAQKAEGQEQMLREKMVAFLKDTQAALQNPTVQRDGAAVNASLQIETDDPGLGLILMLPRAKKESSN